MSKEFLAEEAMEDKRLEQRLRRKLKKYGYELHKSRRRNPVTPEERERFGSSARYDSLVFMDMGGYRITDNTGKWEEGDHFELSLEDVDSWVKSMGYDD